MTQPVIYRYRSVDSTNNVCKALALDGAEDGTVVIAAAQTAGRGRLGRSFESPEGMGLYLSMLWRPIVSPEGLLPLTAMAAASAALALRRAACADIRIKWPNDLVLHGKKLAGLLTEAALSDGGVDYVVLGLGVNLRQQPSDFSPEVAKIATSLAAEGCAVEAAALETALVEALRQTFRHLCAPETYLDEYRQLCLTQGKTVRLVETGETVTAQDIDGQYGLVVRRESGAVETLRFGEVSVRGLYGYAE